MAGKSCTSATPDDAIARLVLMYARNVLSDARWSRATLPEFSSRNPTRFHTWQNGSECDLDKRGCRSEHSHCRFGESEFVSSCSLMAVSEESDPAERDRLRTIGREHDGPLSS